VHSSYFVVIVLAIAFIGTRPVAGQDERVSIEGKVIFKGNVEKFAPKPAEGVESTDCAAWQPILTEEVLINPTTPPTLRNAVVWIQAGPIDLTRGNPREHPLLAIRECRLQPRIITLLEDQQLAIRSEDPIPHALKLLPTRNKPRTLPLAKKGMQIALAFEAEDPFATISPIYPWMRAWIFVFEHPYFSVIEEDGSYTFDSFPPGKYELKAWHETFGTKSATIDAKPGSPNQLDFVFEPQTGENPSVGNDR